MSEAENRVNALDMGLGVISRLADDMSKADSVICTVERVYTDCFDDVGFGKRFTGDLVYTISIHSSKWRDRQ